MSQTKKLDQEGIVVGEVIGCGSAFRKPFSDRFLRTMNMATLMTEAETTVFYWVPESPRILLEQGHPINDWATNAIYLLNAVVHRAKNWVIGDEIRGPVVIKKIETRMSYTQVGRETIDEDTKNETASCILSGIWFLETDPVTKERFLYARDRADLVMGKMIFG